MKKGIVENGLRRKRTTRRKRRNPATATTAKRKNPAKRRSISKSSVSAFAKRNGLKLVSRTVANGKKRRRHHKRRNGLSATHSITRRSNGILGNTKSDARKVGSVLGGAALTKIVGRIVQSFAMPILAQINLGNYAEIIIDGAVALVVTPFVVGKLIKGNDVRGDARLGGLLVVALDAVELFAPQALQYNPFNTSPVVMTNSGPAIKAPVVAQMMSEVARADDPAGTAAKLSGVLLSNGDSGNSYYEPQFTNSLDDSLLVV